MIHREGSDKPTLAIDDDDEGVFIRTKKEELSPLKSPGRSPVLSMAQDF